MKLRKCLGLCLVVFLLVSSVNLPAVAVTGSIGQTIIGALDAIDQDAMAAAREEAEKADPWGTAGETASETSGNTANLPLPTDEYLINSAFSGRFLKYASGNLSLAAVGGTDNTANWRVKRVGEDYVITPNTSRNLYLCDSEGSVKFSVHSGEIPENCKWKVEFSAVGGCLLTNLFSGRLLYLDENENLGLTEEISAKDGKYVGQVWRFLPRKDYSYLTSVKFTDLPLFVGEGESPKPYQIAPQKAHWTKAEDFSYAVADEKVAVFDEAACKIMAKKIGRTTVVATHKPTGLTAEFEVVVLDKSKYKSLGKTEVWNDGESNVVGLWETAPKVCFVNRNSRFTDFETACASAVELWSGFTEIVVVENEKEADIVIYGDARSSFEKSDPDRFKNAPAAINGLTTGNLYDDTHEYLGYYDYYGSSKFVKKLTKMEVFILYKSDEENYAYTVAHELGHALGYYGHAANQSGIMYKNPTERETPSPLETKHLKAG